MEKVKELYRRHSHAPSCVSQQVVTNATSVMCMVNYASVFMMLLSVIKLTQKLLNNLFNR